MMIIDAIDIFQDLQRATELDRRLAKEYGIAFVTGIGTPQIIISDRMWCWTPNNE